jgi:hypothetical protein
VLDAKRLSARDPRHLRSCFVPRGARVSVFGQRALRDVAHVGRFIETRANFDGQEVPNFPTFETIGNYDRHRYLWFMFGRDWSGTWLERYARHGSAR